MYGKGRFRFRFISMSRKSPPSLPHSPLWYFFLAYYYFLLRYFLFSIIFVRLRTDFLFGGFFQILAPRIGYLPLLIPHIKPHFNSALPPGVDTVWFEYRGLPLKWYTVFQSFLLINVIEINLCSRQRRDDGSSGLEISLLI
ncbi:hypothetical protein I3842_11G064700 [Carya illinoinensis]|uniref:Autophagy protein ATG5 UblA domain-containing protein n=1 Tax=Carya illinoinensis TaxID=32201 RepID=A0A922DN76_CARIL|nr:hypothetical protein I3842_11G064700 [Carya illinoinensis]